MELESEDPRDKLKKILKDYEMSLYSFGLISGLDEKTILSFIDLVMN